MGRQRCSKIYTSNWFIRLLFAVLFVVFVFVSISCVFPVYRTFAIRLTDAAQDARNPSVLHYVTSLGHIVSVAVFSAFDCCTQLLSHLITN